VDRVSAGFFYFAEGGAGATVRAQGNLVEMLAVSLKPSASNAEIAALQDGLVDRLLAFFSDGLVSELAVELADALPRMSNDGTGLVGTQLEVFELQARALSSRSARWESSAREIVETLQAAATRGDKTVRVPLYGEARQQMLRPLKVVLGGETHTLPARYRWTVIGQPREELKAPDRPPTTAQPIVQPTPSPPRTGPAVPRPEPTTGMKRLPKQPGGPLEDAVASTRTHAASAASAASAPASAPDSAEARAKADAKPATEEAAPARHEQANGKEPAQKEPEKKEPAHEAPREAEGGPPAREVAAERRGAPKAEAREDREEAAAAAEPRPATPSRRPARRTRRSGPSAIVVLLLLATAVAVYVRWHEDIARFVGQYLHGG
jgi:hypothetical protein